MLEISCTHDSSGAPSSPAVLILESSNGYAPWPWLAPLPRAMFLGVLPLPVGDQACWVLVCKLDTPLVFSPDILIFRPDLGIGLAPRDLVQCHSSSGPVSPRTAAGCSSLQLSMVPGRAVFLGYGESCVRISAFTHRYVQLSVTETCVALLQPRFPRLLQLRALSAQV